MELRGYLSSSSVNKTVFNDRFPPSYLILPKKNPTTHSFTVSIWRDISVAWGLKLGIWWHRKTCGTPEISGTIHDQTKIKFIFRLYIESWKYMSAKSLQSCSALATQWTVVARLLCLWSSPGKNAGVGCTCPPPRIFPDAGLEPAPPALAGRFVTTAATWKYSGCKFIF